VRARPRTQPPRPRTRRAVGKQYAPGWVGSLLLSLSISLSLLSLFSFPLLSFTYRPLYSSLSPPSSAFLLSAYSLVLSPFQPFSLCFHLSRFDTFRPTFLHNVSGNRLARAMRLVTPQRERESPPWLEQYAPGWVGSLLLSLSLSLSPSLPFLAPSTFLLLAFPPPFLPLYLSLSSLSCLPPFSLLSRALTLSTFQLVLSPFSL